MVDATTKEARKGIGVAVLGQRRADLLPRLRLGTTGGQMQLLEPQMRRDVSEELVSALDP